ncbi:MAG: ABC transporter permease [Planctomycetota bacterium]
MIRFLLVRSLWVVLTLWCVFTISFILMRVVPGSPFDDEKGLPQEVRARLEQQFGFHRPLWEQYWTTLAAYLQGDAGRSYRLRDYSVSEVIAEGFPVSATLGGFALWFALVLGLGAGALAASRPGSYLEGAIIAGSNFAIALPNFVIAGGTILLLSFGWRLLPPAGWGSVRELLLPGFCLGAPFAAAIARLTRTGLREELSREYVRTAHAKGLSPLRVVVVHALPLALMPVVSFLGPATAGVLTGSLVIEKIFAIPGLGSHFVQAALSRDYTLALGVVLTYTLLISVIHLVVDVAYRTLDPRVTTW